MTDYYHFGPRPVYVQLMHQDTSAPTFEDCVDAHMAGYSANRSTFDCMQVHVLHRCCVPPHTLTCLLPSQTIGLQVRFFCGITEACRRESSWTLAKAKENLRERFIAVVVVEKMLESFRVLEHILPGLFRGLVRNYIHGSDGSSAEGMHARTNQAVGHHDMGPRRQAFLHERLAHEFDLYDFAVGRLGDQLRACGLPEST